MTPRESPGSTTRPIRVVLVDDHEMILESLRRLLGDDPDIEVVATAPAALEGIERVREQRPDVVVVDLLLPDLDGVEATRRMIAATPGLRVIILTGSEQSGGYYDAIEAGCAAWMRKTRAAEELLDVIHAVHAGRQMIDRDALDLPTMDQVVAHYQPIVELGSRRIVGFEALARWQHPERGLLGPAMFIPLAEESGSIHEIGARIAGLALGDLFRWQARRSELFVSINLSAVDLNRVELAETVAELVRHGGADPHDVVIEITETALLEDTPIVAANLHALKAVGVRLALDDFGTAFSSLSLVRRFPFDHLKIDHSFVAELPHTPRAVLLMEAVYDFASSLGMDAIAEGIEREDQLESLVGAGWKLGQGFLLGRPMAPDAIDRML